MVLQLFNTAASLSPLNIFSFRRKTSRFSARVPFELYASPVLHSHSVTPICVSAKGSGRTEVALCCPLSARGIVRLRSWSKCRGRSPSHTAKPDGWEMWQ